MKLLKLLKKLKCKMFCCMRSSCSYNEENNEPDIDTDFAHPKGECRRQKRYMNNENIIKRSYSH